MKVVKLLWIDDNEPWAQSAHNNLAIVATKYKINFKVVPALNGEDMDISWKAENYDFDCIVMDYHMEPFFGDKYIKEFRKNDHLEHIPVIFYSQDNSTDLDSLIEGLPNIITVYRPNLEDKIKEMFF